MKERTSLSDLYLTKKPLLRGFTEKLNLLTTLKMVYAVTKIT